MSGQLTHAMQLFFQEDMSHERFGLNPEESKHLTKVLRKSVGDIVYLTNGAGERYCCQIEEISPRKTQLKVLEKQSVPKDDYHIHLAIAPTKNQDRLEWMVEKITEIGCHEITFLNTDHTEKAYLKLDRLEKKIISACKQSLKMWKPKLNAPVDYLEFLALAQIPESQKFIAYVDQETRGLVHQAKKASPYIVLIGPEGDFSQKEIQQAFSNGFVSCSLGKSRLRTETAGMVAVHTLNLINS